MRLRGDHLARGYTRRCHTSRSDLQLEGGLLILFQMLGAS